MKKSIRLVLFVITLGCSALISCGNDNKTIEPDKPTTPTEVIL